VHACARASYLVEFHLLLEDELLRLLRKGRGGGLEG
jgi:hypothetical protein